VPTPPNPVGSSEGDSHELILHPEQAPEPGTTLVPRPSEASPPHPVPMVVVMALFAASVAVKLGLLVVATIVFIAVYGYLLDRLQRRGP
jgi:hypothetical protein